MLRRVWDGQNGGQQALQLAIAGTGDAITVEAFFQGDDPGNGLNPVRRVTFTDGTTWDLATLVAKVNASTSDQSYQRGTSGADTLVGGAGPDTMWGGAGGDLLLGGAGGDALVGEDGDDTLDGGAGNDWLDGGEGDNVFLFGRGDGQDTVARRPSWNPGSVGTIAFKAGVDPRDVVVRRVADAQNGGQQALELSIAGTGDSITVEDYFQGDDPSSGLNPVRRVSFADGSTWDMAAILAVMGQGGPSSDAMRGTVYGDRLDGAGGEDTIHGLAGDDTVTGGSGDDALYGEDGNDVLAGGAGDDWLDGGTGNNTYLFGLGDGQDTIARTFDPNAGKINTLRLGAGIAAGDVVLQRVWDSQSGNQNALLVAVAGTDDFVCVNGFFDNGDPRNPQCSLQQIAFDDGTVWGVDDILARLAVPGAGNNAVRGAPGGSTLSGTAGNDTFTLDVGDNTIVFGRGSGQDILQSSGDANPDRVNTVQLAGLLPADITLRRAHGAQDGEYTALSIGVAGGPDTLLVENFFGGDSTRSRYNPLQRLVFADGSSWSLADIVAKLDAPLAIVTGTSDDDTIGTGDGGDTVFGHAGNDSITGGAGDDFLQGDDGDDTLDGGAGDDRLYGGTGNDTYRFGYGDGHDIVASTWDPGWRGDTLAFKAGVRPDDVTLRRVYNPQAADDSALQFVLAGSGETLTVDSFFLDDDPGNAANPVQRVTFADGTVWDLATIVARAGVGSSGDDGLRGTTGADAMTGGDGADRIDGLAGNDTLSGGAGDDTLAGGDGDDVLDGGAGDDQLNGGTGNDTYLFGHGDGHDTITETYDPGSRGDTVAFKADVSPAQVTVSRVFSAPLGAFNALRFTLDTGETLTVYGFFDNDDPNNAGNPVQRATFADGTVWDLQALLQRSFANAPDLGYERGTTAADAVAGGGGADSIEGLAGNDTLSGGGGDDTLAGGDGDDVLDGGAGDDQLNGGTGNDTYLFGHGDGHDTITETYDPGSRGDTVAFKADVSPAQVTVSRVFSAPLGAFNALRFTLDTGETLTVYGFFDNDDPNNAGNPVQRATFADGTVWDLQALLQRSFGNAPDLGYERGTTASDAMTGGDGDDVILGLGGDDSLAGGAGDDRIEGGDGNDTMDGGAGNDDLVGGTGVNTYLFGCGDGQDQIGVTYDPSGARANVLQFKDGVLPADVVVERVFDAQDLRYTALKLSIAGTDDGVTVAYYFGDGGAGNPYNPVDIIRFADGTTWDEAAVLAQLGRRDGMDLAVSAVAVDNATSPGADIRSGDSVVVRWQDTNLGGAATQGDFIDRVTVRDAVTGAVVASGTLGYDSAALGALGAGASVARSLQLQLPDGPSGAGHFVAVVETDADDTQHEGGALEANNSARAEFDSTLAAYADFVNLQAAGLGISPASGWKGGDAVTVTWQSTNAGTLPATGTWSEKVELVNQTTGAVIASVSQVFSGQPLAAGETADRSATFTWPGGVNAAGMMRLRVTVDAGNDIDEFDGSGPLEADNTVERTFAVGPDLSVTGLRLVDAAPVAGDLVTLAWNDVNGGDVPTPVAYQDHVVVRRRNADGSAGEVIVDTQLAFTGAAGLPLQPGESRARSFSLAAISGRRRSMKR